MSNAKFVKKVEGLIDPVDVGTIHFIQSLNNFVPKAIQKKMVKASGQKTPYMGFVVEPYSHFLFYEIKDTQAANRLLPKGYELMKTKVFSDDEAKYYGVFGCFKAHTSGFWGLRIEFYLIARDLKTNMLSWIIVDYDTNTITYDPKNALSGANAKGSIMTTDYDGQLHLEMKSKDGRKLYFYNDITQGKFKELDKKLWIEGNLSIAYGGRKINKDPEKFSLLFNPEEFSKALWYPGQAYSVKVNNWFGHIIESQPDQVVCFPFDQHYLSDSPGHSTAVSDEAGLIKKIKDINQIDIEVFSTESLKRSLLLGMVFSLGLQALALKTLRKKNR